MPSQYPLEGGCSCGLVRYRLHSAPMLVHACHCTICQRATGSAFFLGAAVKRSDMELLPRLAVPFMPVNQTDAATMPSGPATTTAAAAASTGAGGEGQPGHRQERPPVRPVPFVIPTPMGGLSVHRCPACGTTIWVWTAQAPADSAVFMLATATLDRPWEMPPMAHLWTRSRRDFVALPASESGVVVFSEGYPFGQPDTWGQLGRVGQGLMEMVQYLPKPTEV